MSETKGLAQTLYEEGVKVVRKGIIANLQSNSFTDTITNVMSFGNNGGALEGENCREWIFAENPDGSMNVIGTRNYNPSSGERPLQFANEIEFTNERGLRGYTSGSKGVNPGSTYSQDAEEMGILNGLVGGILPGKKGDVTDEGFRDLTTLRKVAVEIALNYYTKVGTGKTGARKSLGNDPFGRRLYTVVIPASDGPLKIFNPGAYDAGLIGEYLGPATIYPLLSPFYKPARQVLKRAGFETDPLILSQVDASRKLAETGLGGATIALYPVVATGYSVAKLGNEHLLGGWKFDRLPV
jgi:hypothetical protein